jgi:hypothetical protein
MAVFAPKDLQLVLAKAEIARVPMPAPNLLHDRIAAMMAGDPTGLDRSALGLLAAAGREPGPIAPEGVVPIEHSGAAS